MINKYIFRREIEQPALIFKKPPKRIRKDMTPFIMLFNDREKARFIEKIFRKNPAYFNSFMQELNTKMTWDEAYKFIERKMNDFKVDMYRKEVLQLTDRVYRLFFPDDISISA